MNGITELQRRRAVNDRRTRLINELFKLGVYKTRLGQSIEDVSLVNLEQIHINEKCRAAEMVGNGI